MIERKHKTYSDGIFSGMLILWYIESFIQDWLGLDKYLKYVKSRWINTPWWLWLIFLVIILIHGIRNNSVIRRKH